MRSIPMVPMASLNPGASHVLDPSRRSAAANAEFIILVFGSRVEGGRIRKLVPSANQSVIVAALA